MARIAEQPGWQRSPSSQLTWTSAPAFARTRATMTTPQDSPRRRKQKARRTKQLNEWRLKKATEGASPAGKKAEKVAAAPAKAAKTAAAAAPKSK